MLLGFSIITMPVLDDRKHEIFEFIPTVFIASGSTYTYLGDKKSDVVSQWPNWDYKTYTVEDLAVGMIRFISKSAGSSSHPALLILCITTRSQSAQPSDLCCETAGGSSHRNHPQRA